MADRLRCIGARYCKNGYKMVYITLVKIDLTTTEKSVILNGTKIQAAGCFLPLAQEVNLSKDLGSRYRAGIGLTETVNVTAIIVSEETGIISIAKGGKIIRYVDTTVLRQTLKQFYWQELID